MLFFADLKGERLQNSIFVSSAEAYFRLFWETSTDAANMPSLFRFPLTPSARYRSRTQQVRCRTQAAPGWPDSLHTRRVRGRFVGVSACLQRGSPRDVRAEECGSRACDRCSGVMQKTPRYGARLTGVDWHGV